MIRMMIGIGTPTSQPSQMCHLASVLIERIFMERGMTEPDQPCKMFPIASAAAMQSRSLQRGPITCIPQGSVLPR